MNKLKRTSFNSSGAYLDARVSNILFNGKLKAFAREKDMSNKPVCESKITVSDADNPGPKIKIYFLHLQPLVIK